MARAVRLTAHRAAARGIPAHLPVEEVESIPFFGRTWYVRGTGYWLRRIGAFLIAALMVAVGALIELGLLRLGSGIGTEAGRWAWRGVWAAQIVLSMVPPARAVLALVRARREGLPFAPDPPPWTVFAGRMKAFRSAAGLAIVISGLTLLVGVIMYFGWWVLLLLLTFQPENDLERAARLSLQRRHRDG